MVGAFAFSAAALIFSSSTLVTLKTSRSLRRCCSFSGGASGKAAKATEPRRRHREGTRQRAGADRNGVFTEPASCTDAKDTWRSDNNHVMQFLADRVYSDPAGRITVQDLYDDYCHWFVSTGLRGQLGRKQFANSIEAAGVGKSSRQSAGYFFEKVSLR